MRYTTPPKLPHPNEELITVTTAIKFANSRKKKDGASSTWALTQYRLLKVLPPRQPYFVDDLGRVHARHGNEVLRSDDIWKGASAATVDKWWRRLRSILDTVTTDSSNAPIETVARAQAGYIKEKKIAVKIPKEGWTRTYVNGLSIDATTQSFVPPTIDSFVVHVAMLMSRSPWRTRLGKCEKCGDYFLNPLGRRGRPRMVCSDECRIERGDRTLWERQKRYRDRQRKRTI